MSSGAPVSGGNTGINTGVGTPTQVNSVSPPGVQKGPEASPSTGRDGQGRFVGEKAQPPAEPVKPSKLKIKDIELDEESAFREIQRGRQATKLLSEAQRRAEAADAKERAQTERASKYKNDLGEFFKDQGYSADDAKKLASEWLYKNVVEPEELTKEERRIRDLESRLKEKEDFELETKSKAEQAEIERVGKEQADAMQAELIQAMDAGVLPKDKAVIGYVSQEILKFAERGVDISIEQGVRLTEEKLGRLGGGVLASLAASNDPHAIEKIASWMGKESFTKLAVTMLKWAASKRRGASQPPQRQAAPVASAPRKRMTPQEFNELQRQKGLK